MIKKQYVLKLIPSRPTFAEDMSETERKIMQEHILYWKECMGRGIVLIFGPVLDPKGPFGLGIIEVSDEEEVKTLIKNDPASRINTYEYYPMKAITLHNQ